MSYFILQIWSNWIDGSKTLSSLCFYKVIDEKVDAALDRRLEIAIKRGVGNMVVDNAPGAFGVILALIASKLGWDLRKQKKQNKKWKFIK